MTMRLSTAMRDFLNKYGSVDEALRNGKIEIYTGTQPNTADNAVNGTLLCTITSNAGTITNEVLATGTVTLTGGSSGSVNTLTVNSVDILGAAVPFNTSLAQTAADVAAQINRYQSTPNYKATANLAVITISALPGTGTSPNGFVVASTTTTLTKTDVNMSGGVNPANGLLFDIPAVGSINKLGTQTWSGINAATGTAGWFRQYGSISDPGTLDTSYSYIRLDGAISTSGAEMNLNSTAFTNGATTTISNWVLTIPAA